MSRRIMMSRVHTAAVVLAALFCFGPLCVSATPKNPNLLLITLDTVRADRLSCNGSKRVSTPHLDGLAAGGVNFTRARTSAPLTLPAHASIMTGTYPPVHGVRDNGSYRLPEDQLALAEVLDEHGYETAAFIGAFVLDRSFGLAQGFDVYDEGDWGEARIGGNLAAERPAEAVYDAFSKWIEERAEDGPFFAWVHLYDPHAPYTPPEPFRKRYVSDPYAGEIAYTDAVVGKIVADLGSRALLQSTLVAVVGDHGEGLGEHGEQTHSLLIYNSTIHVPMLLTFPDRIPPGKTVDQLTRTIDLAPTILDYLGLARPFGQGTSLRSLIDGKDLDEEILAYSESLYPSLNLGWSELRGLEAGSHRFILAPRPELYDLAHDPGERENVIDSDPVTADRLERHLAAFIESMRESEEQSRRSVDHRTEEMLRSLGYVSGDRSPRGNTALRADPKDKIGLWTAIESGLALYGQGDFSSALKLFEKALTEDSTIPILYNHIGWSYIELNQYDRAEQVYRLAIEKGFETSELHSNLGLIYSRWGEFAKAEQELLVALEMEAGNVSAHYRLANVYRATKSYSKAAKHYRRVLAIDFEYVWAANGLAMTLAAEGKNEEALTAFREAVRIDPGMAPSYLNLAVHLERMKRFQEALEAYQKFLDLASEAEYARQREIAKAAMKRLEARDR
jgi:arylsulfatase A-like enzyme/Flp pilus assembly protein TadD